MPRESLRAAELIQQLCAASGGPGGNLRVLLVTAHPDDETIGATSRLPLVRKALTIVCLTDGSPRNLQDARNAGFPSREEYARTRRRELESALAHVGIGMERVRFLGYTDQESCFHLKRIIQTLEKIGDVPLVHLFSVHKMDARAIRVK